MLRNILCAATIVASGLVTPLECAPVLFSSRSLWEAQLGNVTTIDFESIAPNNGSTDFSTPSGLMLSGVAFQGPQFHTCSGVFCPPPDPNPTPGSYSLQVADTGAGGFLKGPPTIDL